MAKFNLPSDKQVFVAGGVVSLKAGEVDTEDKNLIAALSKAQGVVLLEEKEKPLTKAQIAKKLKELGVEFDGNQSAEELAKLLPAE